MARLLGEDIRQRGDGRISEPATVASEFLAGVRERAETGQIEGDHLSEAALLPEHIERSEIGPDTTLNEMADLSAFRMRLRLANEYIGAPWPELKRRVTEKHLPSMLIQSILRDHVQDPPRRKGSELTDGTSLASRPMPISPMSTSEPTRPSRARAASFLNSRP